MLNKDQCTPEGLYKLACSGIAGDSPESKYHPCKIANKLHLIQVVNKYVACMLFFESRK
jgi:hypothetical protein